MKGLFLYGVKCRPWIWDDIKKDFSDYDIDYVEYPPDITKKCKSVDDLTKWVYDTYLSCGRKYDFALGHSMGGLIALHLSALEDVSFKETIFIESFLKPTEDLYKNVMMESNKARIGDRVFEMFKDEGVNYTDELILSLREDFDYTHCLNHISNKVYAVYGNRGNNDQEVLLKSLNLDDKVQDRINISFINNSCHLPMLENPHELSGKVLSILEQK